ncbi:MAG: 3-oxoacyl-[acyl-carrier-protein] reductase [Anaerolineae bacterium]|nr:3-oxoacyl-[acyl-carrier-protein] reductase [Anaerolineae bacterium]MCA9892209.1 3-oxoacyl-[acyl-carrier-protein] reductase [Anaerolineae bacterium]
MGQFEGKIAIVTGGSRGIGRAIALELGKHGATVVVNYNQSADAAEAVIAEIKAAGGDGMPFQCDVSDADQVTEMFKQVTKTYGQLDILVNNAGVTRDNVIMMLKPDDFDKVIDTNLRSAWLCSKAASRTMMKQRSGRIINISSVVGIAGNGGQTNYAASKAGLIGLTKALAKEIAPRGVTVNAVAPGFIGTDMTSELSDEIKETAISHIPLGRMGLPEDVAKAVAFLASDDAAYITGQVLVVDGGMVM